jgi:hypothetical protein|tara:strand:+ start:204 stop:641 length:438 start_codon:yes stop_codon:yes gene_type:complete
MRYAILTTALFLISFTQFATGDDHPTITIPSESLSVEGEVTNLELTDTGGVISVKAIAGKYGLVFITYNMSTNPNSKTQGTFTGRGMGIDDTGNREFAQRRGVWTREGTLLTLHSLDDLTDGTQNLCKSELNLSSGEFEMTFYPM